MASLPIWFAPPTTAATVFRATAAKGGGGSKEQKGLLDFILGGLTKQDQFYETDPILQRADDEKPSAGTGTGTGTSSSRKNSVSVPQKKKNGGGNGVFGGLFAKK